MSAVGARAARALHNNHRHRPLRSSGLRARSLVAGARNDQRDRSSIIGSLVRVPQAGDIVILDTLQSHKLTGLREAIEAVGARFLCLSRDNPDFDTIEQIFATLKHLLRAAAAHDL